MDELSKTFEFCSNYFDSFHAQARGDARSPIKLIPETPSDLEYEFDHVAESDTIKTQVEAMQAFPITPLFNLINRKAKIEFAQGKVKDAALSILQYQANALRHQAIKQFNKRIAQKAETSEEESLDELEKRILNFRSSDGDFFNMIRRDLPDNWRIVQLTTDAFDARFKSQPKDDPITEQNFGLMMVTAQCGEGGLPEETLNLLKIPAVSVESNMPTIMKELYDIIMLHNRLYKSDQITDKDKYHKVRDELDCRMTKLVDTIENKWLGFAKVCMLGKPINPQRDRVIQEIYCALKPFYRNDPTFASSGRRQMLLRILDGASHLSFEQLTLGLLHTLNQDDSKLVELLEKVQRLRPKLDNLQNETVKRNPVILILDNHIQSLPWESLSCLQTEVNPQPMSRIPSLPFLCALAARHSRNATSVSKTGIRDDKIFYVLNPDKNLDNTQKRLEGQFNEMSLGVGIIGEHPSLPEMKRVLSEMDAFMYCGHGSNMKNLPAQEIEKLNVRALPLLFGCNSGRLSRMGRTLDPTGIACYYLIASAPCMLGFLWSVTDKDIDKWTVSFLQHWLGKGEGPHEPEFVRAVANRKSKFKRVLNSAATVVYGLPAVK